LSDRSVETDWASFLGRPGFVVDPALAEAVALGKRVLITGGGGSIGTGLAQAILSGRPRCLVLLDSSEHALYESYRRVESMATEVAVEVVPVVGSISDERLLSRLLGQHKPELILHTAAYKHVPLMERNPFSAIDNNAIGTYKLVTTALEVGVSRLVMVSTDKAVNPQSIMGVSKRIAEMVVLSHSTAENAMIAVRLGNVLGSSGSVVPIFQEQAQRRKPLTVTHMEARRYFLTLAEAEGAILKAVTLPVSGRILIPDCGDAFRIVDLARYVAEKSGQYAGRDPEIQIIGLRPGDKLCEELISGDEDVETTAIGGMKVVASPCPSARDVAAAIQRMERHIDTFDYSLLMETIMELVPVRSAPGDSAGGQ
jgi:FlaA1/EpsC-like NDP-sugar epimerase